MATTTTTTTEDAPAADPTAISDDFARLLIRSFNSQADMPVHLLFNHWWAHAPAEVTEAYVEAFTADSGDSLVGPGAEIADPVDLDAAAALPVGTLGRAYADWIIDNGLQATIATDYRGLHELLVAAGKLDGMPPLMQRAVLRGFQVHDFQHVITGYDAGGRGEIALQAFGLAQTRFPYQGMWLSVVTAQMTYRDPTMITPIMDAVTDGWRHGRQAAPLRSEPWESMLDEPLDELRARYGIDTTPRPGTVYG